MLFAYYQDENRGSISDDAGSSEVASRSPAIPAPKDVSVNAKITLPKKSDF